MEMRKFVAGLTVGLLVAVLVVSVPALADRGEREFERPLSGTSFHDFTPGISVGHQLQLKEGWSVFGPYDQAIQDFGSNRVWRVSNAITSGSFGDQPFAPRPGGIPTNTVTDPDNSEPLFFAGESSTGAAARGFSSEFSFRSKTGAPQAGLRITVSIDNGSGGRQSFVALVDTGTGIDVQTQEVDKDGVFGAPITIASGLSYTDWHTIAMKANFVDGPHNDKVQYLVNDKLVHVGPSWEQFYRNFQSAQHPLGVPVQTLLYRISGTAAPTTVGNGFYVDNVFTSLFADVGQ
jgi:hypothetical protein